MYSIKRDLSFGIAICALVFVCALAWGSPFFGSGLGSRTAAQVKQLPQTLTKCTLIGTIVRDGEQFVLRDASGQFYRLDSALRAQQFEGKAVKVTGQLDGQFRMIHLEAIEFAAA